MTRRSEDHKSIVWWEQDARKDWKRIQRSTKRMSHSERKMVRWNWKFAHRK